MNQTIGIERVMDSAHGPGRIRNKQHKQKKRRTIFKGLEKLRRNKQKMTIKEK